MSERIKELVKKSGISIADFGEDIVEGRYSVTASVNALEKFAELIVKDCAGVYEAIDNGNEQEGTLNYIKALKRRYGL